MLVSVIRTGFRDAAERRRFEAQMIFRHHTLHPRGLNTDFAFDTLKVYAWEKLIYLFIFYLWCALSLKLLTSARVVHQLRSKIWVYGSLEGNSQNMSYLNL